ncbi:potassium-transporting ATPase subunit C [Streptomyces sp. NPDC058412]|uniref:potassium-transporting ATPase subunit C n=1 Tax=Streptomyces sp. NPDC058412 TaxID=3346486 RepID=UPI003666A4F6
MNTRLPHWLAQHVAAVRVVLVLTVLTGLVYPLAMTAAAQVRGLSSKAEGSRITGPDGSPAGSSLIGQSFTDADGNPLKQYFQSRPSNAGTGYDAGASGAGSQGPESVVDTLPTGDDPTTGKASLLTQVCSRSKAVADLEGVDGARPFCTDDGVGATLGVFHDGGTSGTVTRVVSLNQACPALPFLTTYKGVAVECAKPGEDYSRAVTVPVRGDAPGHSEVPADAVTASASGLDPHISPAYADLQVPRISRERGAGADVIRKLVAEHTTGRALGVFGEPAVNVVELNLALDRAHPSNGSKKQGA